MMVRLHVVVRHIALLFAIVLAGYLPAFAFGQRTDLPCLLAPEGKDVQILLSGQPEELDKNWVHLDGSAPSWPIQAGGAIVAKNGDIRTKAEFRDILLHLEFKVQPSSAKRMVGAVLLQGAYGLAIRDSLGIEQPGKADCGAIYDTAAPLVNAALPAGEWQSYDIIFRAARFYADGRKRENAHVTVLLNGVLIQNNTDIQEPTVPQNGADYSKPGPLVLQYHESLVEYRNVWLWALPGQATPAEAPRAGGKTSAGRKSDSAPINQAVYLWRDVPHGQPVPIVRARFDQGGYQLYDAAGELIVVPFQNQNMHVLRFGQSGTGQTYFVNEDGIPTLYLLKDDFLESAIARDVRWFPFPPGYAYTRPIYVALAPTWNEYLSMGWYPGMIFYGGLGGYNPNARFAWTPGYGINVGGIYCRSYAEYAQYYMQHPGYIQNRVMFPYANLTLPWNPLKVGRMKKAGNPLKGGNPIKGLGSGGFGGGLQKMSQPSFPKGRAGGKIGGGRPKR